MKRALATIMLAATIVCATGCKGSTSYGECVGVTDDSKNPHLVYKVSAWNAIVSVFFFSSIVAPVIWLVDNFQCPVGKK